MNSNSRTACGQILRPDTSGVAHRTYRCSTRLKFVSPRNGNVCFANVLDRGPFVIGRTFDLAEGLVRRMGYASTRDFGIRSVSWDFASAGSAVSTASHLQEFHE